MTPTEIVSGFASVATASVADACDKIVGRRCYMDHQIKPRIGDHKIAGRAVTILEVPTDEFVPPQHALDAIDESEPGSVICISMNGETEIACWGGLMTAGAVANGHTAAVLDGAVRDLSEIRRDYDFPVFARSVSPGTTLGRFKTLASGVPIQIGGILVRPGDIVMGDVDGVVVVPVEHEQEVLAAAQEIDVRELEQAKLIIEAKSLREGLAKYNRI